MAQSHRKFKVAVFTPIEILSSTHKLKAVDVIYRRLIHNGTGDGELWFPSCVQYPTNNQKGVGFDRHWTLQHFRGMEFIVIDPSLRLVRRDRKTGVSIATKADIKEAQKSFRECSTFLSENRPPTTYSKWQEHSVQIVIKRDERVLDVMIATVIDGVAEYGSVPEFKRTWTVHGYNYEPARFERRFKHIDLRDELGHCYIEIDTRIDKAVWSHFKRAQSDTIKKVQEAYDDARNH